MNIPVTIKEGTATLTVDLKEGKQNLPIKVRTETSYYEDGYSDGFTDGVLVGENEYIENILPDKEAEAKAVGKEEQYKKFWKDYLTPSGMTSGEHKVFSYRFCGYGWNNLTFTPPQGTKFVSGNNSCEGIFRQSKITNIKQILEDRDCELDLSKATNFAYAFASCDSIEIPIINMTSIPLASGNKAPSRTAKMFSGADQLTKIHLIVDSQVEFNLDSFEKCESIQDFTIEGEISSPINLYDCSNLTNVSFDKKEGTVYDSLDDQFVPNTGIVGVKVEILPYTKKITDEDGNTVSRSCVDLSKCKNLTINSWRHILLALKPNEKATKPILYIPKGKKAELQGAILRCQEFPSAPNWNMAAYVGGAIRVVDGNKVLGGGINWELQERDSV